MECNKDEAIRAMQLAEKKMQNLDFSGAQKIAHKAQRLFPDLENISQLLAVCEVHCSAQVKLGGTEMDWYRILQIEQTVDVVTIKKQYRKFALLLHPDKNKFAGAEAAFKLIGEANRVLSDQTKRCSYDMRYQNLIRTAAPKSSLNQPNGNSYVQKQCGAGNNLQNFPRPLYSGLYSYQQAQPLPLTFWTRCPYCNSRYQYLKEFAHKWIRCQSCTKNYYAHDLGISSASSESLWGQFPNQGPPKVPSENNNAKSSRKRSSNMFVGRHQTSKAGTAAKLSGEAKLEENDNGDARVTKQGVGMPKCSSVNSKTPGSSKNVNRKRRKSVVESSESFNDEVEDEVVIMEDNVVDSSKLNEGQCPRRSSRHKQNVSYKENLSDDDFVNPPKRSRMSKSSGASEDTRKGFDNSGIAKGDLSSVSTVSIDGHKKESKLPFEENFPSKKSKTRKCEGEVNGKEEEMPGHHDQKSKTADSSDLKSNESSDSENFSYPDPDFSDFDKDKAENSFAVNQTWAVYDPADGMPRFYARIKKVFSPGFKLKITWLETDPDNQSEVDWCDKELPVACGKYMLGATQEVQERQMFSHQMHCIKGVGRSTFFVYPRKGETWALFQNWDINWSSDPKKHLPFKFEFVEVRSEFVEDTGIGVAYLGRVKGFVSVFQQTEQHGIVSFQIPPNELYRFSHRIPSYKMTGEEREGVPKGSYELDPVSLPSSLFQPDDHDNVKMDNGSINANSLKTEMENVTDPEGIPASGKHELNNFKRETSTPIRSPRKSNRNGQIGGSQRVDVDNGRNAINHGNLSTSNGSATMCHADESINTPKKQGSNHGAEAFKLRRSPRDLSKKSCEVNGSQSTIEVEPIIKHSQSEKVENGNSSADIKLNSSRCKLSAKENSSKFSSRSAAEPSVSVSPSRKLSQAECYDFTQQKSKDKFKLDQIWALRADGNVLPKAYAQVKKIDSSPKFRVHVVLLNPCSPPKDATQPVSCGIFKLKTEKTKVFSLSSFCHCVSAKTVGTNRYEIYPRKGEVWAVYRNPSSEFTRSNPDKGECDIVEVIEEDGQSTKVVLLFRVTGFKSMYRAARIQRSKAGVLDIPVAEVARFSHQIPAFQHTGENDSRLAGCWELDPLSIPTNVISLD